jgi:hypothetical protein
LDARIPEEEWTEKKVNNSFLKTFGCESFVHIDKENRTKLETKSKKCTFIGYSVNDFSYGIWDYENKKIIRSRYVIFNEKVMYKNQLQGNKQEKKNKNTQCLMRSLKKKFQRNQKIKMYNNKRNMYLKLLQVWLEYLPG